MRMLALIRWELVQTMRGTATFAAISIVALISAGIVGAGIAGLSLWSPFNLITPSFPGRIDPNVAQPGIVPILGEFRGGVTFFLLMVWLLFLAATIAPALLASVLVRDRRAGRLDLVLTDASRVDIVVLAKLLAALVPLGMILLAAGPAISFAWLVGGLSDPEAIASVTVVLVTVVAIAAIGLVCSATASTEVTAILTSYFFVGLFIIGPLIAGAGLIVAGHAAIGDEILSLDPLVGLLSAQSELADQLFHLLPTEWPLPTLTITLKNTMLHAWVVNVAVYGVVSLALVALTSVILEPLHPIKVFRLRASHVAR